MKNLVLTLVFVLSLFSLQAHVKLDYPVGGETFSPGQVITIQWEILIHHDTQNWDLYFSKDGGDNWEVLRADIGVDTLSYDWTVPAEPGDHNRIRIVQDNTGADYEDISDDFTILNSSGISQVKRPAGFSIYPNPAKDYFYLESTKPLNDLQISIVDQKGAMVNEYMPADRIFSGSQKVHIEGLQPGIYYLAIRTRDDAWTEKLIVY